MDDPTAPDTAAPASTAPATAAPASTPADPAERMARFTAEMGDLRLKTGRAGTERTLLIAGVVAMVAGIVLAFGAYAASVNVASTPGTNVDVLNSNSYQILALAGVAISVVGGLVFLRYSLAQFLRLWLLRQSYDQQAAVEAASSLRSDG